MTRRYRVSNRSTTRVAHHFVDGRRVILAAGDAIVLVLTEADAKSLTMHLAVDLVASP